MTAVQMKPVTTLFWAKKQRPFEKVSINCGADSLLTPDEGFSPQGVSWAAAGTNSLQ
jgi:hypothetical protein